VILHCQTTVCVALLDIQKTTQFQEDAITVSEESTSKNGLQYFCIVLEEQTVTYMNFLFSWTSQLCGVKMVFLVLFAS